MRYSWTGSARFRPPQGVTQHTQAPVCLPHSCESSIDCAAPGPGSVAHGRAAPFDARGRSTRRL